MIRIERISTAPITTIVASPLTPVSARPFLSSWIRITPSTVPSIVPVPPKIVVPPSTTAAITSSSRPVPMSERVVLTRETKMQPASPRHQPGEGVDHELVRSTGMPEKRAAIWLWPIA